MIISASRRTDIPAFYSDWFFNRIKEGYVLVPNPYFPKKLSHISLKPEVVDCIVFWTKNPAPMIKNLYRLKPYNYYFQFTINPYDKDTEENLPSLEKRMDTLKRLSDKIGKEKVIWRYDPILINEKYTAQFHKDIFHEMVYQLSDYTNTCMLGFIDSYKHIEKTLNERNIHRLSFEQIYDLAESFAKSAEGLTIHLETCTRKVSLSNFGITDGLCISKEIVEKLAGYPIHAKKDKNQRDICRCIESIDIGIYGTCAHGCIYCYANAAGSKIPENIRKHDKTSPKLIGKVTEDDEVNIKMMKSLRTDQPELF